MAYAAPQSTRSKLLTCCAFVSLLAGCASTPQETAQSSDNPKVVASNAGYWASRYQKDPTNPEAAVGFARELRSGKKYEDALGVLMHASVEHPQDASVFAEMGKILVETGDFKEALSFLGSASQLGGDDWTVYSAAGVAYDQIGSFIDAQRSYEQALIYSANNPTVLSNLGLSYAMSGDLEQAETSLRQAIAQKGAADKVRLNLALVVGLQGRFQEAEEIASHSLPASVAKENVAHLRRLLSQPSRWQDMKALDGGAPPASHQSQPEMKPLDASLNVEKRQVTPASESAVP